MGEAAVDGVVPGAVSGCDGATERIATNVDAPTYIDQTMY